MEACLGIYLGDKIIKYAKLLRNDKTKGIELHSCGTKYVVGNKEVAITEIINQTGSAADSLCLNLTNYSRTQTEVLKQLGKVDTQSVIELEVADYATGKGINEKSLDYRYIFMDSSVSSDSNTVEITMAEKVMLEKYQDPEKYSNLVGLYPQEYILPDLIKNNSNYVLVDADETTKVIIVSEGKIKKIIDIEVSMKGILDSIAAEEGSYSKACELCKSINVLSDESISPDIEKIIEPVIQDLLNRISIKLGETKMRFERIYLNGLINLFINIDMLFEQFFGISTEKIRPHFLSTNTVDNVSEVIDASDAIALAYQGLEALRPEVNFASDKNSKMAIGALFSRENVKNTVNANGEKKKTVVLPNINLESIEKALFFANMTAGTVLAGYVGFGAIYNHELDKMESELMTSIASIQSETAMIKSDGDYIDQNTNKYVSFNKYINDAVDKIREGKIGQYTTYNVANFMQKIAKYIPSNVQIETISSDDNKSVKIVAKSTSYAELGYFISQLKLKGILQNIQTGKVQTGSTITVTIGGDLP